MTQLPPNDYGAQPPELNYATVDIYASARQMVKLAAIFNLVMAGIDGLATLAYIAMAIAFPLVMRSSGASMPATGPFNLPPDILLPVLYGGYGLASLAVGIVKVIAGMKLLRRRRNAWGWGIAAAITGMPQFWCSIFCVIPLAVGIFTLVAMVRGNAREYLASEAATNPA